MLVPPDFTRYHSQSGKITQMIASYYGFINKKESDTVDGEETAATAIATTSSSNPHTLEIIPALGTHAPMTYEQIKIMYGDELANKFNDSDQKKNPFIVHDWRNDVVTIGHAPTDMVSLVWQVCVCLCACLRVSEGSNG